MCTMINIFQRDEKENIQYNYVMLLTRIFGDLTVLNERVPEILFQP